MATINATGYDIRASVDQPYKAALHEMCIRLFTLIDRERDAGWFQGWADLPPWLSKARKLPALSHPTSRAVAEAWFEVAWEALFETTDGHPELLPQFNSAGRSAGHYKRDAVKASSGRRSKFANGNQRGLHARLRSSWMARYAGEPGT